MEKLHFHSNAQQFFFILKGTATFYVADKIESIGKSQGILIEPKTAHHIANDTEKVLNFLVISQPTTNLDRTNIAEHLKISVREIKETDIKSIPQYFLDAGPDFLKQLGADENKLPNKT